MPTQLTTGDLVTAANWNTIPGGVLDYTIRTTAFNNITTSTTVITGGSITPPAGRLLKVTFYARVSADNNASVAFQVSDGTNLRTVFTTDLLVNAGEDIGATGSAVYTSTGSSMTFTAMITEYSAGGQVDFLADSVGVSYLLVEDIGAA